MSVATSTAIGLGVAGAGVASAGIGAIAANSAASKQANAANHAADLQFQQEQQALAFQQQQYAQSQANIAPWLNTGASAENTLASLLGLPSFQTPNVSGIGGNQPAPLPTGDPNAPFSGGPQPSTPLSNRLAQSNIESVSPRNFGVSPALRNPNLPGGVGPTAFNGTLNGGPSPVGTAQPSTPPGAPGANNGVPLSGNGSGFLQPFQTFNQQFTAPTAEEARNTPGYQFQLQQGQEALQNSAAARGTLFTGGTGRALDQYSQGLADSTYNDTFNRSLQQYQTAFNTFNQNQTNEFNRLAAVAGLGQTSAGQLNASGVATGGNIGNTLLTGGAQIGQNLNNAGAATASGYAGTANAINGGLGSLAGLAPLFAKGFGGNTPGVVSPVDYSGTNIFAGTG